MARGTPTPICGSARSLALAPEELKFVLFFDPKNRTKNLFPL
jgi:hypothetical protein